jgi:hypothetical protein
VKLCQDEMSRITETLSRPLDLETFENLQEDSGVASLFFELKLV